MQDTCDSSRLLANEFRRIVYIRPSAGPNPDQIHGAMDMDRLAEKSRLEPRSPLQEDMYGLIVASLFSQTHVSIFDHRIHEYGDKWCRKHRHVPLHKVRYVMHLGQTCTRMRDEVKKHKQVDRRNAFERMFGSLLTDVASTWAKVPWSSGKQGQDYELQEHPFPYRHMPHNFVAAASVKRRPNALEIWCNSRFANFDVLFHITDAEPGVSSDADAEADPEADEPWMHKYREEVRVTGAELAAAARAYMTAKRDEKCSKICV